MDFSGIISGKSVRATEFCAPVLEETNESFTWVQHNCISNKFISEARVVLTWRQTSNAQILRKKPFYFFLWKTVRNFRNFSGTFLFCFTFPFLLKNLKFLNLTTSELQVADHGEKKKTTKAVVLLRNTITSRGVTGELNKKKFFFF